MSHRSGYRKWLAIVLVLALAAAGMKTGWVKADNKSNTCVNHPEHDETCGYIEAKDGQPGQECRHSCPSCSGLAVQDTVERENGEPGTEGSVEETREESGDTQEQGGEENTGEEQSTETGTEESTGSIGDGESVTGEETESSTSEESTAEIEDSTREDALEESTEELTTEETTAEELITEEMASEEVTDGEELTEEEMLHLRQLMYEMSFMDLPDAVPEVSVVDVEKLVENCLGKDIEVDRTSYIGIRENSGIFSVPESMGLPFEEGIMLSTGSAAAAFGGTGEKKHCPGYDDLTQLYRESGTDYNGGKPFTGGTNDAAVLEVELTPTKEALSFKYFFASAEYNQSAQFNDVFALWIIDDMGTPEDTSDDEKFNIARLDDGETVCIQSTVPRDDAGKMDCTKGGKYYTPVLNNSLNGKTFKFLGFTSELKADARDLVNSKGEKVIQKGKPVTIRMAIADSSDSVVDSAVFIKANSITFDKDAGDVSGEVVDEEEKPVEKAKVTIVAGTHVYGATETDEEGKFMIPNIPSGITYNLVVEKGEGDTKQKITIVITIEGEDLAVGKVVLPDGKKDSIVEVKEGTPEIVVDGVDDVYQPELLVDDTRKGVLQADLDVVNNGGRAEVKFLVEEKDEQADHSEDILTLADADMKEVGMWLDLSALKMIFPIDSDAYSTRLTEMPKLITLYIPLEESMQNKKGYVVYRYHDDDDGINEPAITAITDTPNADGEVLEAGDGMLILKARKFSTYAVGYDTEPQPEPPIEPEPPVEPEPPIVPETPVIPEPPVVEPEPAPETVSHKGRAAIPQETVLENKPVEAIVEEMAGPVIPDEEIPVDEEPKTGDTSVSYLGALLTGGLFYAIFLKLKSKKSGTR